MSQETIINLSQKEESKKTGLISKETLLSLLEDGSIDTVNLAICDMQGRLMGKRLTAAYCLENNLDKGTHFCNYLLGTDFEMNTPDGYEMMNWENGYGDWLALPDWSTLRIVPWADRTAIVFCDVYDEKTGDSIPIAPRTLLKNQIEKAAAKGFELNMASELEFYLFKESFEDLHQKGYEDVETAGHINEDYNLLQGTRNEPFYQKIRRNMAKADIPIESSKGEAFKGQHEINMRYSDALNAADNHIMFKHGMKEICMQDNLSVTFMAKPNHQWTGSSGHIHLSLWDKRAGENVFYDPDSANHNMSKTMQHFLAGVLKYSRDFALFFAPYVNSYKRYAQESWAPVNIIWSHDNRSSGYRIVGDGKSLRVETRIPGADMNPYLAYTALIGAGLQGIEEGLELEPEFKGNAYKDKNIPRIPGSLYEAIQCWEDSEVVQKVLGEKAASHYLFTAKLEQKQFDRIVTKWERQRYFEQC
ncbi:glutamine synthetase family protein [Fictibacillus sp. NPDC058756]|uniref:glutamine synthetase family protein n=1 Tax=Fictibacillus sp. NPDC058756 TaxID=3346625 RepID=UPI00367D2A2E